ncbi:MAG: polysaccharide biosynthesis C-terminal domain-containing protein [Elusimicrobia bacterium]|nr:polysaccharide biosynthesis C-terminal domain-containing protein [Elusimicrobiota bacterium]
MFRELRGLAKETAFYGLSTVLGRMLSFLLTPLFTYLLTRSESGVVQTTYAALAFLGIVYGLGLDVAYLRLGRRGGKRGPGAFGGAMLVTAVFAVVGSLAIHAFAAPLARVLGLPPEMAPVVRYAAWILALDSLTTIPYTELRASHRAGTFAAVKLVGIAMHLILAYVFVRTLGLGVRGVFLANIVASAAEVAVLSPVMAANMERPDPEMARAMLALGLPMVLAALGAMVVQVADRPIMARLGGLDMAGVYGNCYKLGIFMSLLVGMFDQAWKPFVLERSDREDADAIIARVLTYFAALACWAFLAIAFFVEPLVKAPLFAGHSLFGPAYWEGLSIVPIVTLGYLFNGLYFVMLAPLLIDKRMTSVTWATWIGAAVNVGVNFYLIPRWGMNGAAWATCIAYLVMAGCVWRLGLRTRTVPYEWPRLTALAVWTALLWAPSQSVGLIPRLILLLAYPVGLRVSGFLHDEELVELKALFSARASRSKPQAPAAG